MQRGRSRRRNFRTDSGLNRDYVSGDERGVRNPSVMVLEKFAIALEVDISELFDLGKAREFSATQRAKHTRAADRVARGDELNWTVLVRKTRAEASTTRLGLIEDDRLKRREPGRCRSGAAIGTPRRPADETTERADHRDRVFFRLEPPPESSG